MNMEDNMVNNVFQMTWEQWLQKFWEQGDWGPPFQGLDDAKGRTETPRHFNTSTSTRAS